MTAIKAAEASETGRVPSSSSDAEMDSFRGLFPGTPSSSRSMRQAAGGTPESQQPARKRTRYVLTPARLPWKSAAAQPITTISTPPAPQRAPLEMGESRVASSARHVHDEDHAAKHSSRNLAAASSSTRRDSRRPLSRASDTSLSHERTSADLQRPSQYELFDEQSWIKGLGWQIKKALSKPVSLGPSPRHEHHDLSMGSTSFDVSFQGTSRAGRKRRVAEIQTEEEEGATDQSMPHVSIVADMSSAEQPKQFGYYRTAEVQTDPLPEPERLAIHAPLASSSRDGIALYPGQLASQEQDADGQAEEETPQERAMRAARAVQEMMQNGGLQSAAGQLDIESSFHPVTAMGGDDAEEMEDDDEEEAGGTDPSAFMERFKLPSGELDIQALLESRSEIVREQQPVQEDGSDELDEAAARESQPRRPLIQVNTLWSRRTKMPLTLTKHDAIRKWVKEARRRM